MTQRPKQPVGDDDSLSCPLCDCKSTTFGYGLAAGPMGAYTFCDGCNELIEFFPDTEGMEEEQEKRVMTKHAEWKASLATRIAARKK